jgi:hypothetical protein
VQNSKKRRKVLKKVLGDKTRRIPRGQSQENIDEVLDSGCKTLLQDKGLMHLTVDKEMFTKKEVKVNIDSHDRGLGRSHSQRNKNAKGNGIKRMSNEEIDKEMVELKERLNIVMKFLQESEEDQRYGWIVRKMKVKWNMLQVKMK